MNRGDLWGVVTLRNALQEIPHFRSVSRGSSALKAWKEGGGGGGKLREVREKRANLKIFPPPLFRKLKISAGFGTMLKATSFWWGDHCHSHLRTTEPQQDIADNKTKADIGCWLAIHRQSLAFKKEKTQFGLERRRTLFIRMQGAKQRLASATTGKQSNLKPREESRRRRIEIRGRQVLWHRRHRLKVISLQNQESL